MRNLSFAITAAASLALASAFTLPAAAQTAHQQGADSNQHSAPIPGNPTAPNETTGSGGPANPGPPGAPTNVTLPDSPDKQPAVATGQDLKGPAKEFPSNKAPE